MAGQRHELDVLLDPDALVHHLWPFPPQHKICPEDYHHFFEFLRKEARKVNSAPFHHVNGLLDRIHRIDPLLLNAPRRKSDLAQALGLTHAGVATDAALRFPDPPSSGASWPAADPQVAAVNLSQPVSRSLDVVARLWLTINFDTFPLKETYPRQATVSWSSTQTLQQAVESHFADQTTAVPVRPRTIPSSFKMTTLADRGLSIRWSSNLADHLDLALNGKHGTVTIYEHVVCLRNHLQYSPVCPIPAELLKETLDTIVLLFPPDDSGTKKLLKGHGRTFWRFGRCGREEASNTDGFRYWRAQIDALLEEYERPPRGARQLRLDEDGRNFLEFSTFWTALAVAVLTILGIGFGTLGTVYAIKAYNLSYKQYVLSQKQYILDLVQACVEREARERWPHICGEAA